MTDYLGEAKEQFVLGLSRISNFWGFPKAMGAIFGVVYLSPSPLSLDDIVLQVGVTKGAVSTNIRSLERLGIVHKHLIVGDRKDYYTAETDFWKIVKEIIREREQNEFDLAIRSVSQSLDTINQYQTDDGEKELADFYTQRMKTLKQFFDSLDSLVATFLAMEDLKDSFLSKKLSPKK
jgi:DNA-binding transcriptional regulator GbsR (MarR family)